MTSRLCGFGDGLPASAAAVSARRERTGADWARLIATGPSREDDGEPLWVARADVSVVVSVACKVCVRPQWVHMCVATEVARRIGVLA